MTWIEKEYLEKINTLPIYQSQTEYLEKINTYIEKNNEEYTLLLESLSGSESESTSSSSPFVPCVEYITTNNEICNSHMEISIIPFKIFTKFVFYKIQ